MKKNIAITLAIITASYVFGHYLIQENKKNIVIQTNNKVQKNKNEFMKIPIKGIGNFNNSTNQLVNIQNASAMSQNALENIKTLHNCLRKDYCGMTTRNDDDSYFDYEKTPAHIYLGRSLEILLETLKVNSLLSKNVDWELIEELTKNENRKISVLALELMSKYGNTQNDIEHMLFLLKPLKGEAKADGFVNLSFRFLNQDKSLFIDALEKTFVEDDNNTVLSVVAKLNKMSLTKIEIEKISNGLCHFKDDSLNVPNLKMLKYEFLKLGVIFDQNCP